MPSAYYLVAILPAIAACLSGNIALYAWQRREINGSREFALCSASIAIWCFFAVLEQLSPTELQQVIFGLAQYLGIPAFPLFWFLFALRHTQCDAWLSQRVVKAFSIVPLSSALLAFSTHWHGWVWKAVEFQVEPFPKLTIFHGWWFDYVMVPYSYLLMLSGFGILVSASFIGSRLRRQQTLMLVSAVFVTFGLNVVYIVSNVTLYGLDLTPIGFAITMLLIQLGLFHVKFLDVAPISYKTAFLNAADAVILLDQQQRIVDLNPSALAENSQKSDVISIIGQPFNRVFPDYWVLFEKMEGRATEITKVLKFSCLPAISPDVPQGISQGISQGVQTQGVYSQDAYSQNIYRQVKVRAILAPNGRQGGWVVIIRDVTLEQQQQAQLERLAYVDSLTGLSNRRQLERKAEEILIPSGVRCTSVALLYVDVDRFKLVNDNYGHDVGDAVLQYVAHCLKKSVRQGDMVVRLGGDEFVAMLYETDISIVLEVRSRLIKMITQTVTLAGHQFMLTASIGIAHYPADGTTLSNLLRQADQNMYREKRLKKAIQRKTIHRE